MREPARSGADDAQRVRAIQDVADFEKTLTTNMPAAIKAMPPMAGPSSVWPKATHPTREISTMPTPDQTA